MAKRSCRTADWLDPTRVPRPCRGIGGTAPPASVGELRHLLQWGAHAPCTRQGFAAPSPRADSRAHRTSHLARRSPPALRSDGIIGRHKAGDAILVEDRAVGIMNRRGNPSAAFERTVIDWAAQHQAQLALCWALAQSAQPLGRIE